MSHAKSRRFFLILAFAFVTCAVVAQEAKVKVNVTPTLGVSSNGMFSELPMFLGSAVANPPAPDSATGGRLEIKGIKGSDLLYLNGIGPQFLVGTVEETRNKVLLLPPGQQHVILVDPNGNKQVYSTYVVIKAGQKSTLHVDKSDSYYETWAGDPGLQIMGVGNAPILPVTGTFTATNLVNCGQKARLVWATNGVNSMMKMVNTTVGYGGLGVSGELAIDPAQQTSIQGNGKVAYSGLAGSGEMFVDPGEGTTYVLESFGPGGVFISAPQTVRVNKDVHTTLTASPAMMRYHRVGDKVIEDPMVTLNWTADNADSVRLDPIGPVTGTSGQQVVKYTPGKNDFGPIEEVRMYKITATNTCGGTDTSTASVQVAGSIDPEIVAQALPPVLPKTGSPLPLIGLLGLGSVVSGLALRMFRKR